jgi:ubiquinol-cytochrome c reductase cytochrome b subunit
VHIIFLHEKGSNNPLGILSKSDKVTFYPYYIDKDLFSQSLIITFFLFIVFFYPLRIISPSNFLEVDYMFTPEYIEPEWYLLAPYRILRSVPKKVGGVLMLVCLFVMLFLLPFFIQYKTRGLQYNVKFQVFFYT